MCEKYDYNPPTIVSAQSRCKICEKSFYIPDKAQYVYKRDEPIDGKITRFYFCSWSCLCAYDKQNEDIGSPRLTFWCDYDMRRWLAEEALKNHNTLSKTLVRIIRDAAERGGTE